MCRLWETSTTLVKQRSFLKDSEIVEDRIIAYGDKKSVKLSLDELSRILKKDKDEFINW